MVVSLGLRAKLIIVVAGTVGLVQAASGLVQLVDDTNSMRTETIRRGQQIQAALAVPCGVALANREIENLDAVLWRFGESEGAALDLLSVAVTDLGGRVVASTDPRLFGKIAEDEFSQRAALSVLPLVEEIQADSGPALRLSMPVVSGRRWGTITSELSLSELTDNIAIRKTTVIAAALLSTAVTALLLYLTLSQLVLSPLGRLARAARKISSGDLDARVVESSGGDQLGLLERVFNEMANDMQSYTTELEAMVERRTMELSSVNLALEDSNKELESAVDRLAEMARTDGLTGLLNRRALTEAIEVEIRRADREKQQFSFLMIDVDYFKKYNDAFGHPAGDQLLIQLSAILKENTRAVDVVARFGGEEFVVLLSGTKPGDAVAVAEKLRESVKKTVFRPASNGKPIGKSSVSIGIAGYPADSKTKQGLMSLADQALYLAKEAGRNLVVKCGGEGESE